MHESDTNETLPRQNHKSSLWWFSTKTHLSLCQSFQLTSNRPICCSYWRKRNDCLKPSLCFSGGTADQTKSALCPCLDRDNQGCPDLYSEWRTRPQFGGGSRNNSKRLNAATAAERLVATAISTSFGKFPTAARERSGWDSRQTRLQWKEIEIVILSSDAARIIQILRDEMSKEWAEKVIEEMNLSHYASEKELHDASLEIVRCLEAKKDFA